MLMNMLVRSKTSLDYLCGLLFLAACAMAAATGRIDVPRTDLAHETAVERAASAEQGRSGAPPSSIGQLGSREPSRLSQDPAPDSVLSRGKELFARQCVICHGENDDGAGSFAYPMNQRPRNIRLGNFKLSTTQNQIPTDEDLLRTISRGMPGSAMMPWGHLPQTDLQALVRL